MFQYGAESGVRRRHQQLTVTSAVQSLPSGILLDKPTGTRLSVQQVATYMISISDNTATNMLIQLLGRSAVEAAARDTGMADPAGTCRSSPPGSCSCSSCTTGPALADRPLAHILEVNDGGLGLSGRQWRTVWFKGGSEPGVLTLNYLATTRSGKTYMVSVLTANPAAPISDSSALTLLSAIRGAYALAAG